MLKSKRFIYLVLLLMPALAFSQQWQAESGDRQVAVLELFTSEGCGLCPAADKWVETTAHQNIADGNLIVLGFHIDYLNDKKGWIDKYAKAKFSERQRQLARLNLYKTVYTPEFVISGEVVHNWRKHAKEVIKAVNGFKPEADISVTVEQEQEQLSVKTNITIEGDENKQYSKLYLAVVEDNLVNKVNGGDNAGKTFNHQHLVRDWIGPLALNESGASELVTEIKLDKDWSLEQTRIVALVQNLEDGFVLQSLVIPLK